jgi:hypothetical protein|tara:strand:+ start:18925 stop:21660 length:2736 start_codon:yes stop_codon:yes gene_type:complete
MRVFNAMQLKAGAKKEGGHVSSSLTQPIQFLPANKKNDDWSAWNLDWLELQGMEFLRRNARKLLKNYKLAKGIIDKKDYIIEEDNDHKDLMDVLTKEDESALELKFYPIIPNVVNVLSGEFSKRFSKVQFRAVDDTSYNEMLESKRALVEQNLLADAQKKQLMKMLEMGLNPGSEEAKEMMDPQKIKSLPEIEDFFSKSYRSMVEEWATHQMNVDIERFKMQELEERAFRDMLIADREFWHFRMLEDDYDVELWNPVLTFYQKSPETRYISDSNYAGKMDLMTVSDVIDKYGYLMNEKQLKSLNKIYPARSSMYQVNGYQNDGSYYDASRSHAWNTNAPSLNFRRYISNWSDDPARGGDIVSAILNEGEDVMQWGEADLMRVTTVYWKTQRKVGHLTCIKKDGTVMQELVDETFKVSMKPVYDTTLIKNKTKENLLEGEHVDYIWINEVWGGVKIGPNSPTGWRSEMGNNVDPIYLGIDKVKPGRIPFQFKGDKTLYGCKLPVEGRVFSDRNTRSTSLVDLMKAYQVGYNMVNNQIADILVDELGTIIMFDQNALPRHGMGEDWGKNNYAKAFVAMKDFQMLPLDTSITNTENATNFNHYQTLNMEQTNRLMSRIQLANYFKSQAFEAIGINPQRLGGPVAQQTATGVTQALQQSFAQTETYFINHSDNLMPRVHKMRTDLAQYYYSNTPSLRLQYISTAAEKVNFTINGTDLLMRDFNIFATTRTNHRQVLEQLKQMALTNNTTGASIYDLGNILKADSIAEVTDILKDSEQKTQAMKQQEMQQQRQMQEEQLKAQAEENQLKLEYQSNEADKERQNNITVAEIRAAGYGSMMDLNENKQSDYQDALKDIQQTSQYREQMNMKREQNAQKNAQAQAKLQIDREKLATQRDIANKNLQIARENKNKYDKES